LSVASPFIALRLSPDLLAAIGEAGYEAPTAIHARTIPPLLAGRELAIQVPIRKTDIDVAVLKLGVSGGR
jgi:superfamily II DNA/RNA helicase